MNMLRTAPPQPAVDIQDISFSYDGREPVLQDVRLSMPPGEFLAVLGPNGGGKTTLLRLILGLLRPDKGSISLFGSPPASANNHVGYVPQFATMHLDFPATVLDMVLMGGARPSLFGGGWAKKGAAREKALAYLDILGLGDYAKKHIRSLSGGQRQRALVARALMSRPEHGGPAERTPFLLLLDEPTASIDSHGKFCFYEFLGNLRGSVTTIVVTHDLFMVSPFFNSIAFINKTLTRLQGNELSPENLNLLFGQHLHACPVADIQHAGGILHPAGCSHPACALPGDAARAHYAAARPARACCDAPPCSHAMHGAPCFHEAPCAAPRPRSVSPDSPPHAASRVEDSRDS